MKFGKRVNAGLSKLCPCFPKLFPSYLNIFPAFPKMFTGFPKFMINFIIKVLGILIDSGFPKMFLLFPEIVSRFPKNTARKMLRAKAGMGREVLCTFRWMASPRIYSDNDSRWELKFY